MLEKKKVVKDPRHFDVVHVPVEELNLDDHLDLGHKFENLHNARGLSYVGETC